MNGPEKLFLVWPKNPSKSMVKELRHPDVFTDRERAENWVRGDEGEQLLVYVPAVEGSAAQERARIIALIEKWRDGQVLETGDMVDRMSRDFTRASAREILDLIQGT